MERQDIDIEPIDRLIKGAPYCICGRFLKSLTEVERQSIYNHYEYERLSAKYNEIMKTYYGDAVQNWNQVLFIHLFQSLGDVRNKQVYRSLARAVGYNAVLREHDSLEHLEALLLGTSGLLQEFSNDSYIISMKREAEYQLKKFNIKPLVRRDWNLSRINPCNHPVLRLSQAAALFLHNDFFLDKVLACTSLEDVENIFKVEASDYWTTHYTPRNATPASVKRIGSEKCNIIGINLVVMIQFAYGTYIGDDSLVERSHNLLQDLKAETNTFTRCWRDYGIRPQTAYEGQALLQIAREYCAKSRCRECYLGSMAQRDMSWLK